MQRPASRRASEPVDRPTTSFYAGSDGQQAHHELRGLGTLQTCGTIRSAPSTVFRIPKTFQTHRPPTTSFYAGGEDDEPFMINSHNIPEGMPCKISEFWDIVLPSRRHQAQESGLCLGAQRVWQTMRETKVVDSSTHEFRPTKRDPLLAHTP
ncbi:hypothetical protein vseg_007636 [Gypsophila vaccaria]